MGKKRLTRESVKAADDLKSEDVDVPEWGGLVTLREMTVTERLEWVEDSSGPDDESETEKAKRGLSAAARLIILTARDEDGNRVFKPGDVEWLIEKSPAVTEKVAGVALKLSGVGTVADTEGKGDSDETGSASS